jgi:RNA polymerase sigma-70 factor (ECF subfamily)
MATHDARADAFDTQRPLLLGVAYRVLGRVADAEDVVQEAWLRWSRVDPTTVKDARAFLVRVVTRLALDRLRRIKAQHEEYVGPWLPEPIMTQPDPVERVERTEAISLALLVVLESLSPLERAVFVLHEVFGYSHAEIAEILGRNEAAVRQLATRARNHVHARRPRFDTDPSTRREVTDRFLQATSRGDLSGLLEVLAPGVTLVADGGGLVRAPRMPLEGADAVARFFVGVSRPEVIAAWL